MKVAVGDAIPSFRMENVTPERMKTVAAIFRDPFPVHWDRDVTRAMGFEGRLLNQSPINLGYVLNMLRAWAGEAAVERIRTEFPDVVFDGDGVTAGTSIIVTKPPAVSTSCCTRSPSALSSAQPAAVRGVVLACSAHCSTRCSVRKYVARSWR